MTGSTTIGSARRPLAVVGRLVLDGSGNLSGISSVSFTGLIFGNSVTGKYGAQTDCSVGWTMQDSSGNFQHFAGTITADGSQIAFRQTDPGGSEDGILLRTGDRCSASSLAGSYQFTASGRTVEVNTSIDSRRILLHGVFTADGTGNVSFSSAPGEPAAPAGTYEVAGDCFVKLALELPAAEHGTTAMQFRAIIVENGRELLGIQTDPGTIASLRWIAK